MAELPAYMDPDPCQLCTEEHGCNVWHHPGYHARRPHPAASGPWPSDGAVADDRTAPADGDVTGDRTDGVLVAEVTDEVWTCYTELPADDDRVRHLGARMAELPDGATVQRQGDRFVVVNLTADKPAGSIPSDDIADRTRDDDDG